AAEALGPVRPDAVVVAADAARGDEDDGGAQLEAADAVAVRRDPALCGIISEASAADADDGAPFDDQLVDPVAVGVGHQATVPGFLHAAREGGEDRKSTRLNSSH